MKTKVFYVEDEINLGQIVKESLERKDFEVVWETDGAKVMRHFNSFSPEICVLDIMLPNIDGYTLCAEIRHKFPKLPIIFLTAKTETEDLVKGFNAGGTDYIRKPFSMEELNIRIKNQLQIHSTNKHGQHVEILEFKIGKYSYYPNKYELQSPTKTIKLSQREKEILHLFATSKNRIIDRKDLLLEIWGDDSFFNSRNLDVYIRKLRNLFIEDENIHIQTLKGKGYLFLTE